MMKIKSLKRVAFDVLKLISSYYESKYKTQNCSSLDVAQLYFHLRCWYIVMAFLETFSLRTLYPLLAIYALLLHPPVFSPSHLQDAKGYNVENVALTHSDMGGFASGVGISPETVYNIMFSPLYQHIRCR
jgi:hypothetical protein